MSGIALLFISGSIVLTAGKSSGDDYVWPMKLSPELTSRFCDYRSGHFHAGLDIRTRGKTGYRVYAVNDGYISRVTTSHTGYGKAVYLKLDDGRMAVYGHLLRFTDDLDEHIRQIQLREKRYRQDRYFKQGLYRVRKGQVIGYSGASGSGAPHLHFELRSADNNPINPLVYGLSIMDTEPPRFDKLAVRSYARGFDPGAPCDIEIIDVVPGENGYTIPDTIIAEGYLTMAVSGGDRIDNRGFLYGFYRLDMYVNDSLVFSSVSDSITYKTTSQQDYVRDMELSRLVSRMKGNDNDEFVFFRLYIPPGARQFFWPSLGESSGILHPSSTPGQVRSFEIVATDESGNESRLTGEIMTPHLQAPDPEFISYYRFIDTVEVDFLTMENISRGRIQARQISGENFDDIECSTHVRTLNRGNAVAYLNTVKAISPFPDREYRFSFSDDEGRSSPWVYFADGTARKGLKITGSPDHLRILYYPDSIYASLSIVVVNGLQTWDGNMIQAGLKSHYFDLIGASLHGASDIIIRADGSYLFDSTVVLNAAVRGSRTTAYSPDSALTVTFEENSSFYPVYVFASNIINEMVKGRPAVIYDIEPADFIADIPVTLRFDLERLNLAGKNMGVYGFAPRANKWGFILGGKGSTIEAEGLGLGRVALIEDIEGPSISAVRPRGTIRARRPLLSCTINDDLSGVNLDESLSMWIDGTWVPAEYDIDTKKFSYQVRNNLKKTRHKIEIRALDNQGNETKFKSYFTIRGG